jgi:hypothetical protein
LAARDLSYLSQLGRDRVVVSLHAGVNTGPARGALLKLAFADNHIEVVLLPPGWIDPVISQSRRFLADFRPSRKRDAAPMRMFAERQPTLTSADYAAVQQKDVVTGIGMLASTNALGLELELSDGRRCGVLMAPAVVSRLKAYLDEIGPLMPPISGIDIPDPQRQ